jgi:hypothetical protein
MRMGDLAHPLSFPRITGQTVAVFLIIRRHAFFVRSGLTLQTESLCYHVFRYLALIMQKSCIK